MELFADPFAWLIVIIFSISGVIFSLPTYYVGREGAPSVRKHLPQVKEEQWLRAENWFNHWGALVLLLTAVPGLGTVLPPTAGLNGIRLGLFVIMVFIGKLIRYWILALLFFGGYKVVSN